jgi:cell division protein FtsB
MEPRHRDERSKTRPDGKPVAASRRGTAVMAILLFVALGLVVDGVVGERGWLANRRGQAQLEQAQRRLDKVSQDNLAMSELAARLRKKDPVTVEELARRERGFIRPGETRVTIREVAKAK